MSKYRILFVCMGNICRSPAAEGVMSHLIKKEGLEDKVECDSAGTISFHKGQPADSRMTLAAKERGVLLYGRARQVERKDLDAFDLVLGMDSDNLNYLNLLVKTEEHKNKIKGFWSYCSKQQVDKIPDPYYGGNDGFEHVLDLLEDGCAQLLVEVKEKI